MRWKGIIFLAVLLGIVLIILFIFTDAWLEAQLEDLGASIVGAKVEIDDLDISLIGLHVRWQRLQVTNPKNTMKNLIETGKCEFNMEFLPLLSDKIIIENIALTQLRSGTDRETDGRLPREEKEARENFITKTSDRLQKNVESSVGVQLSSLKHKVNVDSIMKLLQIQSIDKITALQASLEQKYDSWEKELSQLKFEEDLKKLETRIKSLDINKIKTVEQFQSSLKEVNEIKASIDSINKSIMGTKEDLTSDLKQTQNALGQVDDWIQEDYDRARSMAKIPEISMQNIAKLIFGKTVVDQFTQYLAYIAQAREYANKFKSAKPEKEESPPRLKGQNIYFYSKNARPDFWIKNIELSGITGDQITLEGNVQNIVSTQKLIGSTTKMLIAGSSEKGASLKLNGELNYLQEKPAEDFKLSYTGFSLNNTYLSQSKFLPNKVAKGMGVITADLNLSGDEINSEIKFVGNNLRFDYADQAKPSNKFEEIIQSIVRGISTVDFKAKVTGKSDDLHFSLNSNLDDIFVRETKAIVSKEVEEAKQKIKSEVDKQIGTYRGQLNEMVQEKEKFLTNEMQKYERLINEKIEMADAKKKEIEKQIEKEKSKLKDKVKDIIKF